jgi:ubiquinone/menaquinone biosynthesis C-methylase UbiE
VASDVLKRQMSGISTVMRANGGGRGIRLLDVAGGTGELNRASLRP